MKIIGKYFLTPSEIDFFNLHPRFKTDGRIIGNIAEDWFAKYSNGVRLEETAPYDVLEPNGIKSEIRSCVREVSFGSSKEVGYGRKITNEGFQKKLDSLDRYIIIDSQQIDNGYVSFIEVTKDDLESLKLGKNKKMKATKFFRLVYGD